LTLLVLIALAIGVVIAYRAGIARGRGEARDLKPAISAAAEVAPAPRAPVGSTSESTLASVVPTKASAPAPVAVEGERPIIAEEKARIIVSYENEAATLRRSIVARDAERTQLADFAEEGRRLERDLAQARGEAARYRQLVIDIETNAPPPLLDGPGTPDDLKLIVGVGPVLERMLYQLGVSTFRQIARWSERDIDEVEARLPEFPGRIRRDQWVVQARTLHLSKYGEALPPRSGGTA
jgi:predicted flap endonuclease-1-like 5' DNA nuclease